MGAWGAGLYSDDYALDLKTTVSTVCRLPLDGDEILELLVGMEPAATEPADEDHTTFWLVVADQLHRRGIATEASTKASEIISEGTNLDVLRELGMSDSDLKKRSGKLKELGAKLSGPLESKARRTLKSPQAIPVQPGEVYVFEVDSQANAYNPYVTDRSKARFEPVGWSCCLVVQTGHAFDYLAWVQLAPDLEPSLKRPTLQQAIKRIDTRRTDVGTLPASHVERMGWELLGRVSPPDVPPSSDARIKQVVASDIGACNITARNWPQGTLGPGRRSKEQPAAVARWRKAR